MLFQCEFPLNISQHTVSAHSALRSNLLQSPVSLSTSIRLQSIMYKQALLTTALLAAISVKADQADQVVRSQDQNLGSYLTPNQLSKFASDAESVALGNTAAADAVNSWQATQTAVSNSDIKAQANDYLNAFITATATALPPYLTALPTSLQSYVSSVLVGEASLVMTEVAPLVSSVMASASASGYVVGSTGTGSVISNSANSTYTSTFVASSATSGMPSKPASTAASGSPTTPPSPPKPQGNNGAGRNQAIVAAGLVGVGLAGIMSLL